MGASRRHSPPHERIPSPGRRLSSSQDSPGGTARSERRVLPSGSARWEVPADTEAVAATLGDDLAAAHEMSSPKGVVAKLFSPPMEGWLLSPEPPQTSAHRPRSVRFNIMYYDPEIIGISYRHT